MNKLKKMRKCKNCRYWFEESDVELVSPDRCFRMDFENGFEYSIDSDGSIGCFVPMCEMDRKYLKKFIECTGKIRFKSLSREREINSLRFMSRKSLDELKEKKIIIGRWPARHD